MTRIAGEKLPVSRGCRCGLPLDPPNHPHWLPSRDPEPGPDVQAVAQCGYDPLILRWERTPDGWHCHGAAAAPYDSPPEPWARVGRCWNGTQHPVCDVIS